ncbi:hypothetical protein GGR58DRAFT_504971 [Xylaria digitata]|nr:hypothetical protein GGR58DRAFT_504971 [Xylaria digitata]
MTKTKHQKFRIDKPYIGVRDNIFPRHLGFVVVVLYCVILGDPLLTKPLSAPGFSTPIVNIPRPIGDRRHVELSASELSGDLELLRAKPVNPAPGIQAVQEWEGCEVVLVGHSSGGGLSQLILSEGDARVKRLALLGAIPGSGSLVQEKAAETYRAAFSELIQDTKLEAQDDGVNALRGEGDMDNVGHGVELAWVPGAGHHLQNDTTWQIGAEKLLAFLRRL